MKTIRICMIACVLGMFAASCRNNDCNTDTMANETTAPATATSITDGTQAATGVPADTPAQMADGMDNAERESAPRNAGNRAPRTRTTTTTEATSTRMGTGNGGTPAEVDLKATQKREEHFTHGTGAENTGK